MKNISGLFKENKDMDIALHPDVEAYSEEEPTQIKEETDTEAVEQEFDAAKKAGFFSWLKSFFVEEEQPPQDIPEEMVAEEIQKGEEQKEEAQEEEAEVYDAAQKGWIKRFLTTLFGGEDGEQNFDADEIAGAITTQDDLKEVARISMNVMRMLPPERVAELKNTEDFQKFKEILKSHNLVRETEQKESTEESSEQVPEA